MGKIPDTYWIGCTPDGRQVAMRIVFAWRACNETINRCYYKYPGQPEDWSYIRGHNRRNLTQITEAEYLEAFVEDLQHEEPQQPPATGKE